MGVWGEISCSVSEKLSQGRLQGIRVEIQTRHQIRELSEQTRDGDIPLGITREETETQVTRQGYTHHGKVCGQVKCNIETPLFLPSEPRLPLRNQES